MTRLSALASIDLLDTANTLRSSAAALRPEHRDDDQAVSIGRRIAGHDFRFGQFEFQVALYKGGRQTDQAASLLERAYARLGYACDHPVGNDASSVSLEAAIEDRVVGTLCVTLESPRGIQAQSLYAREIEHNRRSTRICEFTRLAIDTTCAGREVVCSLFYIAYVYAHLLRGAGDLFIEVNPRHAAFYKRMLGFRQCGDEKLCPRVGAPAVLLHLDFDFTAQQIERSRRGLPVDSSKLYQHAASAEEEAKLLRRIEAGILG